MHLKALYSQPNHAKYCVELTIKIPLSNRKKLNLIKFTKKSRHPLTYKVLKPHTKNALKPPKCRIHS